jgi:hypothetical protein
MVLGTKSGCKILPITIISKLVEFTQMKLAINQNPCKLRAPKLSESGPKTKGPNPSPRKIIVMSGGY